MARDWISENQSRWSHEKPQWFFNWNPLLFKSHKLWPITMNNSLLRQFCGWRFLTFLRCFINCDWYLLCDQHLIWWIFMVFYDFIFNIKNQFNQNKHLKVCCPVPTARSRNSNFELLRGRLSRWAAHRGDPSQGTTADNIDSTGFNCVGWA